MEQAVLGALLLEKDALNKIVDVVRPEMFYKESNKLIYESVNKLFQNSEPIDLLTVKNQIQAYSSNFITLNIIVREDLLNTKEEIRNLN